MSGVSEQQEAACVCKLQISDVCALKRAVPLIELGLILDTPEIQNNRYYFTSKAFAASIKTGVNNEINL